MRLLQYLNEDMKRIEMEPKDQIQLLKDKCKKYIKLTKNTGPFYRGVDEYPGKNEIFLKDVRLNRKPSGTNKKVFGKFNKWLYEHGHNRRDQTVSASTDLNLISDNFGEALYFFPIGNFSYTWIRAQDVNLNDSRTNWNELDIEYFFKPEYDGKVFKKSEKEFSSYFTTNKGIEIAHKKGYEIWFHCKQYYLTDIDVKDVYI